MAYLLSLAHSSPFKSLYSEEGFGRPCSPIESIQSSGTVQHKKVKSFSSTSLSSVGSILGQTARRNDDSAARRASSSFNLTLQSRDSTQLSRSIPGSRRASLASVLSSRPNADSTTPTEQNELRLVNVKESEDEIPATDGSVSTLLLDEAHTRNVDILPHNTLAIEENELDPLIDPSEQKPFRRWMSTLRRKKVQAPPVTTPRQLRWTLDDFESRPPSPVRRRPSHHQQSSSYGSSIGFVTAVKSVTATIASTSIATLSRHGSAWRRRQQQSSIVSGSEPRPSVDTQRSVMDETAKLRSKKRREKLEELMRSEESYVADLKALSNAYFTLLGHQPTSTTFARSTAQRIIAEMVHLHEDLLRKLQQVVPFAEFDHEGNKTLGVPQYRTHTRWHSTGAVPTRSTIGRSKLASIRQGRRSLNINRSSEEDQMTLRCSPQVMFAVVKVFTDHMDRFPIYDEFGANYDMIQHDIDETQRNIHAWADYDRAIETISSTINPMRSREANKKKAMTMKDLLIKPIQHLPRYELLFHDLCKLTPVCDGPDAHAAIEELRGMLNNMCQRMNMAKRTPERARNLETTWLIGDRLNFSSQVPRSVYLQLLGQVILCGSLHIAYRSRDRIKGSYIVCVLFESTFLLASADDDQPKYKSAMSYCSSSWKVVFEHSARMYEIIFSACSEQEATVWRKHLQDHIDIQSQAVFDGAANVFELQSPLTGEMRSVGKAFGKPGSFVRRMSVHRTATVGPTTDLSQVVIRGTQASKDGPDNMSHSSLQIPRSQSVFTPSHVQTLAPRRADRVRLETTLADVWSKDLLPYPGMTGRRAGPLKASANHVIRKFSMASITSNFSSAKRNGSYTSIHNARKEDMPPPRLQKTSLREHRKMARPPIDFHTAPEAFLPADFELQDPVTKRKKSALRTFTMTMERPFSPLLGNEAKPFGLRRAHSVHDVRDGVPVPAPIAGSDVEKSRAPIYSVVQERSKTPAPASLSCDHQGSADPREGSSKTPRKSKSRNKLLRLFA